MVIIFFLIWMSQYFPHYFTMDVKSGLDEPEKKNPFVYNGSNYYTFTIILTLVKCRALICGHRFILWRQLFYAHSMQLNL